jgi:hypothetical protein
MESEKYKMSALEGIVVAIQSVIERIVTVFGTLFTWIFKLRKIFMALPVLYAAMELAKRNLEELPEVVGFDIQSTGEFAQMVSRDTAVYGPFALTVLCVVLMLMSRKTIYPWLISIFTLVLPLLIWVLNAGLF